MKKAREIMTAANFAEFERGMQDLWFSHFVKIGLLPKTPVKVAHLAKSPSMGSLNPIVYKKRGIVYERPSARQYFDRKFPLGHNEMIPQANGRRIQKFLRLRKNGTPYWAMK